MAEVESNSNSAKTGQMTFVWNIYDLDMSPSLHQKPIKSPYFGLHPSGKPRYHFELYPKGKAEEERCAYASLYLIESKEKEKLKKVKHKYSASVCKLSPGAEVRNSESVNFKHTKKNDALVIPYHLFPEGDVSLRFEISYENDISTKCHLKSCNENLEELSSAISRIYDNKSHWDTVLHSRGRSYLIHRAILDARFPKLSEQLSKNENTVSISSNIETDVTENLMRYMYSGKLDRKNIPTDIYDAMATAIYDLSGSKSIILGEPRSIFAFTHFKKFHFSFTWRIENFSKLKPNENRTYFFRDNTPSWTWIKVYLCLTEENMDGNEDIILFAERHSCICKTILCRIKVSDLDKTFKHNFDNENMWRIPTFFHKNTLENKSEYLSNDELNIDLEIYVSDGTYDSEIDKIDFIPCLENTIPQSNADLELFQEDLQNLMNNPKFSDVIIFAGKDEFHVHKFILSERSPVFHRMLRRKDKLSIANIDSDVVKSVIKYIYCGEIEDNILDTKKALALYSAASKYEILNLQIKCVRILKAGLSSENAVDILLAAHVCCDQNLKQHVNDFICSNPHSIIASKEWENIKGKKDLVLDLLDTALTSIAAKSK